MRFYGYPVKLSNRYAPEVHIGNGQGRIALWLDDKEAHDLAYLYGLDDLGARELLDAIEKAYTSEDSFQDRTPLDVDPASEQFVDEGGDGGPDGLGL